MIKKMFANQIQQKYISFISHQEMLMKKRKEKYTVTFVIKYNKCSIVIEELFLEQWEKKRNLKEDFLVSCLKKVSRNGVAFVVHILIFNNNSWKYAFNKISTKMSHGSSS